MDNFDPYEILGLTKRFTLEELKYNYKKVAKRVHPDRGGNEKMFKLVSLAYKQLIEIYKLKQINKEFNELKSDFQEFTTFQDNNQRSHRDLHKKNNKEYKQRNNTNINDLNTNFTDVFNRIYDDHKVYNPYDNGYGNLMTKSEPNRPDIDIKRTVNSMKNFNKTFDDTPISKNNQKIIKYRDPIALPSSLKSLKYTEIGVDKISDFSTETNDLNCVDYKKAYSTSKLIDKNNVRQRSGYNDINSLEAERSNINYTMSDEDLKKQAYLKKKEQLKELKRLERIQQIDMMNQNNFNKINNLMINYKR
jgi:curved DNA-binding protein CbpA